MNNIAIKQAQESDIPVLESILLDTVNWLCPMVLPKRSTISMWFIPETKIFGKNCVSEII